MLKAEIYKGIGEVACKKKDQVNEIKSADEQLLVFL